MRNFFLVSLVDRNEPRVKIGVVFKILYAPVGVAGVKEELVFASCTAVVGLALGEGLREGLDLAPIVFKNDLMVVVVAVYVVVDSVSDVKHIGRYLTLTGTGREGDAVDARAGKTVGSTLLALGVKVLANVGEVYGGHDAVSLGVHADAVDLVNVENGNVKGVLLGDLDARTSHDALADRVVLVFDRAPNAAIAAVEGEATKMTRQTLNGADDVALHIRLDKDGGEGIIYVLSLGVNGDALNVAVCPFARKDRAGKSGSGIIFEVFKAVVFHFYLPFGVNIFSQFNYITYTSQSQRFFKKILPAPTFSTAFFVHFVYPTKSDLLFSYFPHGLWKTLW